jgi:hypothetical protein
MLRLLTEKSKSMASILSAVNKDDDPYPHRCATEISGMHPCQTKGGSYVKPQQLSRARLKARVPVTSSTDSSATCQFYTLLIIEGR